MNDVFSFLSRFNRRDQTALLICALVVTLYLLWALLLNPLANRYQAQLTNNAAASESLARVNVLAAKLKLARESGNTANPQAGADNISQLVYSSLQENGISLTQFQPGSQGEARVRLDRAPFEPLLQWLYELENNHQVTVRELSIAMSNDPGLVTVNARLQH